MRAALDAFWARLGFDAPAVVERLLLKGTLVGAAGASLGALLEGVLRRGPPGGYALAFAAAGLLLALPRQHLGLLAALGASTAVLTACLPWTPASLPFFFTVPLGLALALEPLPPLRRLVALVGPSLGGAWCLWVVQALAARHLGPVGGLRWVATLLAGLFVSAGAALAWVQLAGDAIEPRLSGAPKVQLAWLRLRAALARLPAGRSAARMRTLATAKVERFLCAREAAQAAERAVDGELERETTAAVRALQERLAVDADEALRGHLTQLLRVHRDTLEQLASLRRKQERLEAEALAQAAWLDTAAFSLELAPPAEAHLADVVARLGALATA